MNDFSVNITPEASYNFLELLKDQNLSPEDVNLRLAVVSAGCSGLMYDLILWPEAEDITDHVIIHDNIRILVDAMSAQYLNNATIEWNEGDLVHSGFKVNNPNATSTCGCKSSFSAEGVEPSDGGCGSCSSQG